MELKLTKINFIRILKMKFKKKNMNLKCPIFRSKKQTFKFCQSHLKTKRINNKSLRYKKNRLLSPCLKTIHHKRHHSINQSLA